MDTTAYGYMRETARSASSNFIHTHLFRASVSRGCCHDTAIQSSTRRSAFANTHLMDRTACERVNPPTRLQKCYTLPQATWPFVNILSTQRRILLSASPVQS